jgi:4-hydroxy-tetrahydrodipicolinate synthase
VDFGRVITAMVTPFDQLGQIDWRQMEVLIDFLIDVQKTDGLVVCGTTGESPTLTEEEKLQVFEHAVKYVNGRCKIIAGTGSYDTAHSINLTLKAEKLGVDGILLVSPYYNRPSQEGLYQHFKAIADATSLPVMLYNIPKRTGVTIQAETMIRLSQIPNVFATKEAHGDFNLITEIVANTPDDFLVYSGDDNLILPMLAVGGYGVVSVCSHVIGKEIKQMVEAYLQGNVKEAAALHGELNPTFNGLFICPNPVAVKYALSLKDMPVGGVRLPLVEPTESEKEYIRQLFV